MKPIAFAEILNLYEYEKVREARRREVIGLKAERRVEVGRYLSFVFESRETVWFQIQEMVRAERIVDDGRVADEIEVYNTLLPHPGELAATMFIEIGEAERIKPVLDSLLGIDTGGQVRLTLSAVHFVRFALPAAARQLFPSAEVALVVDHPADPGRTDSRGAQPPRHRLRVTRAFALVFATAVALGLSACSAEKLSPEAERGRQVYLSSCTACHSADPAQPGPVGPEIKGASQELLEAKLLRGTYPPGYKPKRPTSVMPPQPQLARDIPALAAYLR